MKGLGNSIPGSTVRTPLVSLVASSDVDHVNPTLAVAIAVVVTVNPGFSPECLTG